MEEQTPDRGITGHAHPEAETERLIKVRTGAGRCKICQRKKPVLYRLEKLTRAGTPIFVIQACVGCLIQAALRLIQAIGERTAAGDRYSPTPP